MRSVTSRGLESGVQTSLGADSYFSFFPRSRLAASEASTSFPVSTHCGSLRPQRPLSSSARVLSPGSVGVTSWARLLPQPPLVPGVQPVGYSLLVSLLLGLLHEP